MNRPRLIPVLLLHKGGLVKTINFKNHNYIGDPLNAVKIFNDLEADELIFLDIDATKENRTIDLGLIREIGDEANMPFSVGGGITSIDQITTIIQSGAERVVLGSAAIKDPQFVVKACSTFGASTISVCMDIKKDFWGKLHIYTDNGKKKHKIHPITFAKQMEELGVGELIIQSISKDGTMSGFDMHLIKDISDSVSISIVGLGGGGSQIHFKELFNFVQVSGISSGSAFVYKNEMKGVLINYPTDIEKKLIYGR